jgi:hypothetical protein
MGESGRTDAAVPIKRSCVLAPDTTEIMTEKASTNANTVKTIAARDMATKKRMNTGIRRKPTASATAITLVKVARGLCEYMCTRGLVDLLRSSVLVSKYCEQSVDKIYEIHSMQRMAHIEQRFLIVNCSVFDECFYWTSTQAIWFIFLCCRDQISDVVDEVILALD